MLIIADDSGIDASPCYPIGIEKPLMPNLERLCAEGLVSEDPWEERELLGSSDDPELARTAESFERLGDALAGTR